MCYGDEGLKLQRRAALNEVQNEAQEEQLHRSRSLEHADREQRADINQRMEEMHDPLQDYEILDEVPRSVRDRLQCKLSLTTTEIDVRKDSTYMQDVKQAVRELSDLTDEKLLGDAQQFIDLKENKDRDDLHRRLNDIEARYIKAIEKCRIYVDKREPSFFTSKQRFQMVKNTMEMLQKEADDIIKLRMDVVKHPERYDGLLNVSFLDLLYHMHQNEEAQHTVENLELKDFARIISNKKQDQLLCRNGRLYRRVGSEEDQENERSTEENFRMADRMVTLLLRSQNIQAPEQLQRMRENLLQGLGAVMKTEKCPPVSMEKVRTLFSKFNFKVSDVDRVLHEENAQTLSYRTASRIDGLLGNAYEKGILEDPKQLKDFETKLKNQLLDIINKCEQNGRVSVLRLKDEDLDFLVKGRIQLIRDRVYNSMMRIYENRKRLGQDPVQEISEEELQNLMGLAVTEAAADTEYIRQGTVLQIKTIEEQQSVQADPELLQNVNVLNIEEFRKLRPNMIRRFVHKHPELWKRADEEQKQAGLVAVLRLITNMQEISLLVQKGIHEGLSPAEAALLRERAQESSEIYAMERAGIELIKNGFPQGSAVYNGLDVLNTRVENQFGAHLADQIAEKLTRPADQQNVQQQEQQEQQEVRKAELMTEEEAFRFAIDHFEEKPLEIVKAIFLDNTPAKLIKQAGDAGSREIMMLRNALHKLTKQPVRQNGQDPRNAVAVTIQGVTMVLRQNDSGNLVLRVGQEQVLLPHNAQYWVDTLEADICSDYKNYNPAMGKKMLLSAIERDDLRQNRRENSRVMYERFLTYHFGIPAEDMSNLSAYDLRVLVGTYCRQPDITQERIRQMIESHISNEAGRVYINSQSAIECLNILENRQKEQDGLKVHRPAKPLEVPEKDEEWTKEEKAYLNLLGEFYFSGKTKEVQDEKGGYTSGRLIEAIQNNMQDFLTVLNMKPDQRTRAFLQLRMLGPQIAGAVGAVEDMLQKILKTGKTGRESMLVLFLQGTATEEKVQEALKDQEILDILNAAGESMKNAVDEVSYTVQEKLIKLAENISTDSDDKWKHLSDYTIAELIRKGMTGEEGEGAFNKLVLSGYISNASKIDREKMLACALKNAPKIKAEDVKSEEDKQSIAGKFMAGYIKGAGPLLHKMLQGLPVSSMEGPMQMVVADVRSSLMEIDEDIVDAQLQHIIEESNGTIDHIDKVQVLGAASVGQTILVNVFEKGKTEGIQKVVKILRPDVQNSMKREIEFMENCAKQVDADVYAKKQMEAAQAQPDNFVPNAPDDQHEGGMLKTFRGKVKSIRRELDLRLEADNVELGKIYEDELLHIRSMKVDSNTKSTIQTLVLEKAKGVSLDKYIAQMNEKRYQLEIQIAENRKQEGEEQRAPQLYQTMKELEAIRGELVEKQRYLVSLTRKWLDEAVFGGGFFHGDLHAGNMMVDDEGLTIIDYGNADRLSKSDQKDILNLMAAASRYNESRVESHLRNMLSPEAKEVFDRKKDDLHTIIKTVIKKEDGSPVQKVLAVLNELQKEEIEIPSGLYNFIQCFVRITGTMEDYKALISSVDHSIENVMESEQNGSIAANPENDIMNSVRKTILDRTKRPTEEQRGNLDEIVRSAMDSAELNTEPLIEFTKMKHSVQEGFQFFYKDVEKNRMLLELAERMNSIFMLSFDGEVNTTILFKLFYTDKFSSRDAELLKVWYENYFLTYFSGVVDNRIVSRPAAWEEEIRKLEESRQGVEDPQRLEQINQSLAFCQRELEISRRLSATIVDKYREADQILEPLMNDITHADPAVIRRGMRLHFEAIRAFAEQTGNDDAERDFFTGLFDISTATIPVGMELELTTEEERQMEEQRQAEYQAAKEKMLAAAAILHRRSNPKSYRDRLTETVIDEQTCQTLGETLQREGWFAEGEEGSEALHAAYDGLAAARGRGELTKDTQEVQTFLEAFTVCLTARASRLETITDKKNHQEPGTDENSALEDMIRSNMKKATDLLDLWGIPYIKKFFEYKMKEGEKANLAQGKKQRKSEHVRALFQAITASPLNSKSDRLKGATKEYVQLAKLVNVPGPLPIYISEDERNSKSKELNDSIQEMMRVIANLPVGVAQKRRIDGLFAKYEEKPSIKALSDILEETARYLDSSFADTEFMDADPEDHVHDNRLSEVYDRNMANRNMLPEKSLVTVRNVEPRLGEDGKRIPLADRLRAGEVITWINNV